MYVQQVRVINNTAWASVVKGRFKNDLLEFDHKGDDGDEVEGKDEV